MSRFALLVLTLALAVQAFAGTGRMIIVNSDKPGQGFNDPTPATPIGGNPGTTVGAQRLAVLEAAAARWTSLIDTNVDITVTATFASIPGCTEGNSILGQARPMYWKHSFAAAPQANVWYPAALANAMSNTDLEPSRSDIFVQLNADVDNAQCLTDSNWYYGLDNNHGNDVDLYLVALHELAHGLGISGATGAPGFLDNRPASSDLRTFDESLGLRWDQMSDAQRAISVVNTGKLVWDGPNVKEMARQMLAPTTALGVTAPASIARNYDIGSADFGTPANLVNLSGAFVLAQDAANVDGPSATDGCSAFSNAGAIAGQIAVVDRGTCTFLVKARNAVNAGAKALVIIDNQRTTCLPPGMTHSGDATDITIPVVSITANDGDVVRAQFGAGVNGALRVDPNQRAGATSEGRVRLYAPCTQEAGSSTHHWDVVASPNLLMEPSINTDLTHGVDLTLSQLIDLGWTAQPKTGRRVLKRNPQDH